MPFIIPLAKQVSRLPRRQLPAVEIKVVVSKPAEKSYRINLDYILVAYFFYDLFKSRI